MKPLIAGAGVAALADAHRLEALPEFRKATIPMLLACAAVDQALDALPAEARASLANWGLVVGVDKGELEVTKDFLCTLAERGIARPFLFQNALHNAPLGFLSMRFGFRGPGFTVGTHGFAGEDALELATDLLASRQCDLCLVVGVEHIPADLISAATSCLRLGPARGGSARGVPGGTPGPGASHDPPTQKVGPPFGVGRSPEQITLTSTAGALLLASPTATHLFSLSGTTLSAIERMRPANAEPPTAYHGADAIHHVATSLLSGRSSHLTLTKPDGSYSQITLGGP